GSADGERGDRDLPAPRAGRSGRADEPVPRLVPRPLAAAEIVSAEFAVAAPCVAALPARAVGAGHRVPSRERWQPVEERGWWRSWRSPSTPVSGGDDVFAGDDRGKVVATAAGVRRAVQLRVLTRRP